MMSYDDGAHWQSLQLNLPVVPVHDLVVHGDSLAVATHGRAFWMIDDLSPVRQWAPTIPTETAHLFKPAVANHTVFGGRGGGLRYFGAANPPAGAVISYTLSAQIGKPRPAKDADKDADKKDKDKDKADPLDQRISLDILDESGKVIRHFPESEDAKSPGEDDAKSEPQEDEEEERASKPVKPPHLAGFNTFVWDLRTDKARAIKNAPLWAGSVAGPKVLPGRYQVRLTVDGSSQTQPLEILADPRGTATRDELAKQFALHSAINALLTEVHDTVLDIRATRVKIMAAKKTAAIARHAAKVAAAADALDGKLTEVEEILIQPRSHASEDALNFPVRLNNTLAALGALVGSGDAAPTAKDEAMFTELKSEAASAFARWRELKPGEVAAFEKLGM
jgi:hypothetical protein